MALPSPERRATRSTSSKSTVVRRNLKSKETFIHSVSGSLIVVVPLLGLVEGPLHGTTDHEVVLCLLVVDDLLRHPQRLPGQGVRTGEPAKLSLPVLVDAVQDDDAPDQEPVIEQGVRLLKRLPQC